MFYFNGTSSESKGLVVSKEIRIPKPEKRFEKIDIEGRSGYLTIDKGTYEPILVSIECHIINQDMSDIFQWLDGYGTFSIDNEYEYEAIVVNQIDLKKVAQFYNDVLIQFELQPVKHAKDYTYIEVDASPKTVTIDSTAIVEPIIELDIVGDIDITINGATFMLRDITNPVIMDSRLKTIVEASNISNKMYGAFPTLKPGTNTISYHTGDGATFSDFKIKYKKAYL